MGQDPNEVRRDIEETRARMGDTLDAIGDRVSPGQIAARRRAAVRNRMGRVRDTVMGPADRLMASGGGDGGGGMRDQAAGVREQAGATARAVADRASDAPEAVRSSAQGNPIAAGMIAFGAGLLTASLFPPTARERRVASSAQPQLETAAAEVGQRGTEVVEELKGAASEAADQLKESGTQAAQEVKETARSSAEEVASQAKGSAKRAGGTASDRAQATAKKATKKAKKATKKAKKATKSSGPSKRSPSRLNK